MNRSGGGALALALLMAVWAGSGGMHSSESVPPPAAKPAPQQTLAAPAQPKGKKPILSSHSEVAHTYEGGFDDQGELLTATITEATSATLPPDDQRGLNDLVNALPKPQGKVGFMIALAPNPVRTHMSLTFDRSVDALEQALQDNDFDFDRALLPWDNHDHPESDNYLLRAGEEEYRRHAEMIPGVLIFRRHQRAKSSTASDVEINAGTPEVSIPTPVRVLVVFVVDDMPTSGVDRTQFEVALALCEKLSGADHSRNLLIMGPSFSGSLASLKDLLIARAGNFRQITIASGQVEGRGSIEAFKKELAQNMRGRVNFASFEENDQSLLNHLYEYACSQWKLKPEEIALVSETETAFGRQPSRPVDVRLSPDCRRPNPAEMMPLTLHFPRGIYHIRTAYEQQFGRSTTSDDVRQARANLRPNLEESRATADTIPDYSLQSPVSQDAVLMGVVDELHRRQSQLVVLMASDSLDILFLVRYLRKNYAYGRLVILSPDMLLRHESEEPDMRGILTINPYSLRTGEDGDVFTASEPSEQGHDEAITFADDGEKGTYNATMALTACMQNPKDPWCTRGILDPPEKAELPADLHLVDYGRSALEGNRQIPEGTSCCRPDLHIDTLGRDGYWPVAVLEPGVQSWLPLQRSGAASPPPFNVSPPVAWKAVVAAVLACFALILLCLERASLLGSLEPELLLAPAGLKARGTHGLKRAYLITFLCTCWTGIVALVLWPVGAREFRGNSLVALIGVAGVAVYGWFVSILVRRYRRPMWLAHFVALGILLAACLISQLFSGFRIFFIKYVNVGSGISPMLPLLLVALSLAWWGWYNIAGSVLTDLRRPLLPRSDNGRHHGPILPAMLATIGAEEQHRLEFVMGPASADRRIWIPIGGVMLVVIVLIFPSRPLRGIEHYGYDYLMIALLVMSFTLLLESILRGIIVWTDAKRLLRSIESQPFSRMISRQDGFTWTSIWKIGTGLIDSAHRLVQPELEALKVVQQKAPTFVRERHLFPAAEVKYVWDVYFALLAERRMDLKKTPATTAKMEDDLLRCFRKLQEKLADAAAVLLGCLFTGYQEHPSHTCELDDETMKKLRATPLESWEEWAEHYVSLVYINYIITILLRIRTVAMAAVGIFVLDVLAVSAYPFEPRAILRTFMFTIFAGITICFGYVYAQMHRDRTLSRITDTSPEELGSDFWFRMLGITGLPLLSLVATEFPSIGNFIFSWIEPAMKALR